MHPRFGPSVGFIMAVLVAAVLPAECWSGAGGMRRSNDAKTEAWVKVGLG